MWDVPAPVQTVLKVGAALLVLFLGIEHYRAQRGAGPAIASSIASQTHAMVPEQARTSAPPFQHQGYTIRPLAEFTVHARVLSREDYRWDAGAAIAPIDLALGWKRMAEPRVYEALHISQGGRWYRYSWSGEPPIPPAEIIESSANMHLVPASPAVERALRQARPDGYVRLQGKLVEATQASGWRWTSSLTRTDSGAQSCELVYVESAQVE